MSTTTRTTGLAVFLGGFLLVALVLAGVASYAASSNPDGLDAVTQTGCEAVEVGGEEQLTGECIAQNAGEHATGGSPFADYTVGGDDGLVGVAGVLGVIVTLALAGGLFWVMRGRAGPRGRP